MCFTSTYIAHAGGHLSDAGVFFVSFLHQIMYKDERGNVHWSAGRTNEQVTKILFSLLLSRLSAARSILPSSTVGLLDFDAKNHSKLRSYLHYKHLCSLFLFCLWLNVHMLLCTDTGVQCSFQYCLAI